jgi:putative ABC transport system permease protein
MSRRSLSLTSMVWRHLWARPLTTALNLLLLTLGFAAMSSMLLVQQQAERQFQQDLAGIDLVVGAKGSPLQLMLSGVFHLDAPTGNIPASALPQLQAHPMVAQVVPLALGDTAQGFRIVGTTADYLSLYGANLAQGQWRQQAMQTVVGATVARQLGWQVGQTFHGSHGLGEGGQTHADHAFTVAGVLAPTGTVLDRLILTPVDSVWALHDHHDQPEEQHEEHHDEPEVTHDDEDHQLTVLLVRYRSPLAAISLPRWINEQTSLQAASPALEAARLFNLLGVGVALLQGFAVVMLAVAALSVFMALSQAVQERQPDLATLRMLGASPWRIASMVLGEALALAALGVCLGLLGGHLLVHALAFVPGLPPESTTRMTGWDWAEPEYALIGLAVGLAVLASAWPTWLAYRASRQQLLHAVRYP